MGKWGDGGGGGLGLLSLASSVPLPRGVTVRVTCAPGPAGCSGGEVLREAASASGPPGKASCVNASHPPAQLTSGRPRNYRNRPPGKADRGVVQRGGPLPDPWHPPPHPHVGVLRGWLRPGPRLSMCVASPGSDFHGTGGH